MHDDDLFEFEPLSEAGRATLTLRPEVRGPVPVSRLLYGKFCEHLGSNIYQGMEAQVLYNPTFAEIALSEEGLKRLAARPDLPDAGAMAASVADGGALGWIAAGSASLSPDAGAFGNRAQRFETAGAGGGVAQWAHLPLQRTRGYEYRVVARAHAPCRVELALAPAGEPLARGEIALTREWRTFTGRLEVPETARLDPDGPVRVGLTAGAAANVVVDRILLYPDDHVHGADPDVIRMLKDARLPLLRWPGGNFVSGYHWRDGVGPVDARPTRPNPAWRGTPEPNLFGTDEFMTYCRDVGCEPLICVNAGSGTPEEAAAWVEYCNGGTDTAMGGLRAENGHPEPYRVRYWEIGNEIFGRHQIGWTTPGGNVDRFGRFAAAMRGIDPSVRLLACGGLHLGVDAEWNRRLTTETAGRADCQTHHILEGGSVDETVDCTELFHAFMGYPVRIGRDYRLMRQRMLDAGIERPRLAITELQLFAHFRSTGAEGPSGRDDLPSPDTISEALYATLIIHECIRLGELVEMVTHSATVNHGGGLRKRRERVWANPVHSAHVMGMALAGGTPLGVRLSCPTISTTHTFGHLPVVDAAPALDAMAVADADGATVLMLVHRSAASGPVRLTVDLGGLDAVGEAAVLTLAGEAINDRNTFEQPERIVPAASTAPLDVRGLELTLPPYSLTRVTIPAARPTA